MVGTGGHALIHEMPIAGPDVATVVVDFGECGKG